MACLYVACGVGGMLKAGMTADPKARQRTLKAEFKKHGDPMVEVQFFDAVTDTLLCEHYLHMELREVATRCATGREWYSSGDFAAAKAIAERITNQNRAS